MAFGRRYRGQPVADNNCDLTQRREGGNVPLPVTRPATPQEQARVQSRIMAAPGTTDGQHPVLIRAARANIVSVTNQTGVNPVEVLPANEMRCYFLIQNTGLNPIRVAFGVPATTTSGLLLNPGAIYEAPIAPTNSVSVMGIAPGTTFSVLYANDKV